MQKLIGDGDRFPPAGGDAVDFHTDIAEQFDRKYHENPDFIERFQAWSDVLQQHGRKGGRCLDLGCGSGVFSFLMAEQGMEVVAVDGSDAMLAICEAKNKARESKVRFLQSDIRTLPADIGNRYDLILCSSVLEYVPEMDAVIRQIRSLLADDGVLVFSIPNGQSLYRKMERVLFTLFGWPGYYRYVMNVRALDVLRQELAAMDLRITDNWYFGRVPLLTVWFRRLLGRAHADSMLGVVVRRS